MVVRDIPRCIDTLNNLFPGEKPFRAEYSGAWHPNESGDDDPILRLGATGGIYFYSEPGNPEWNLNINENGNSIWYIGKSSASVRSRVWKNLGNLYESDGSLCNPRFRHHRWMNDSSITDARVKNNIANGDFVAYGIDIVPQESRFDPEIIETFLLCCYYRSMGKLPVLNSIISQYKVPR